MEQSNTMFQRIIITKLDKTGCCFTYRFICFVDYCFIVFITMFMYKYHKLPVANDWFLEAYFYWMSTLPALIGLLSSLLDFAELTLSHSPCQSPGHTVFYHQPKQKLAFMERLELNKHFRNRDNTGEFSPGPRTYWLYEATIHIL